MLTDEFYLEWVEKFFVGGFDSEVTCAKDVYELFDKAYQEHLVPSPALVSTSQSSISPENTSTLLEDTFTLPVTPDSVVDPQESDTTRQAREVADKLTQLMVLEENRKFFFKKVADLVQHRPVAFKFDWERFFLENESIFYKDVPTQRCEQ